VEGKDLGESCWLLRRVS